MYKNILILNVLFFCFLKAENNEINDFDENVYDLKKSVYSDFLRLIDMNKITDSAHIDWLKNTVYFSLDQYKEIYDHKIVENVKISFEKDYKKIIDFSFLINESRVKQTLDSTINKLCITEYGKNYLENDDLFQFIQNDKDYKIHFNNLVEKQNLIKKLVENDEKFNELEAFLKNFKKIEDEEKEKYIKRFEPPIKPISKNIIKIILIPIINKLEEVYKELFKIPRYLKNKYFLGIISLLILEYKSKLFKNSSKNIQSSLKLGVGLFIYLKILQLSIKGSVNNFNSKVYFFKKYFNKKFKSDSFEFKSNKFLNFFDNKLEINTIDIIKQKSLDKVKLTDNFVGQNIKKNGNEFLHLLKIKEIGSLDALYAKAAFLREQKKLQRNDFNFPIYLTKENGPIFNAQEIFSPEYKDPVKNSLNLGEDTNRNILIVGPSGSGKTDIERLSLKCILMGNLGIVPGNLSYTPFQSIGQNIKNIQNINLSKGEQERFDNTKIVKNGMDSDNPSFNIFDEIYSAVDDKTSKILCQKEIVPLLKNKNSINLINTHFSSNLFLADKEFSTKGYFMLFKLIKDNKDEIIDYEKMFKVIEKNLENKDLDFWLSCDEKTKEKIITLMIEKEKNFNN